MRHRVSICSKCLILACLAAPAWAGFMKADTIKTCLSGDCKNGAGKMKFICFDTMWEKSGVYEGGFRNGLPHGKGLIRNIIGDSEILVKGTWSNGKYHGLVEYSDFMERNTDNEIHSWKVNYENDAPHGELTGFDRNGKLLARWQYDRGALAGERYYYPDGREIHITGYRDDYIDSVLAGSDTLPGRFREFFLEDYAYRRKLTFEQTAAEIVRLQREIVRHEGSFEEIKSTGILVCHPENFIRGYVLTQMHINRLTDYAKRWNPAATVMNSMLTTSAYMAQFLSDWGLLTPTAPEKQPDRKAILKALNDIRLPRKVLNGIRVYITPFSIPDTNGFYDPGCDSIFLFGGQSFKWPATETTVGHEMGHAFHYRVLSQGDFNEYWKLRKAPPRNDSSYDTAGEAIAEDFRILCGGSDRTSVRRARPGRFGDIRDYPDRLEAVKNFFDKKIRQYRGYNRGGPTQAYTIRNASITAAHHPWLYGTGDGSAIAVEISGDVRHTALVSRVDMKKDGTGRTGLTEISSADLKKGGNTISLKGLEPGLYRIDLMEIRPDQLIRLTGIEFMVYRESR